MQRRTAGTHLASTAAFSLDASLDTGAITVAEQRALPVRQHASCDPDQRKQLREYLEFSARYYAPTGTSETSVDPGVPRYNFDVVAGADYALDLSRAQAQRVTRLEVRGRPVATTTVSPSRSTTIGRRAAAATP